MRAFVAVELTEEIRAALGRALDGLARTGAPVKWTASKNLHLTLKFLGAVAEEDVPRAVEILRKCAAAAAPFELAIAGIGAFPDLRRPRVIFARGVETPASATALAKRLDREMTRVGAERERRPLRAHITLGRVRKPGRMDALKEHMEKLDARDFGRMTVNEIALIKSDLTPDGPIYTAVECAALGTKD